MPDSLYNCQKIDFMAQFLRYYVSPDKNVPVDALLSVLALFCL